MEASAPCCRNGGWFSSRVTMLKSASSRDGGGGSGNVQIRYDITNSGTTFAKPPDEGGIVGARRAIRC